MGKPLNWGKYIGHDPRYEPYETLRKIEADKKRLGSLNKTAKEYGCRTSSLHYLYYRLRNQLEETGKKKQKDFSQANPNRQMLQTFYPRLYAEAKKMGHSDHNINEMIQLEKRKFKKFKKSGRNLIKTQREKRNGYIKYFTERPIYFKELSGMESSFKNIGNFYDAVMG